MKISEKFKGPKPATKVTTSWDVGKFEEDTKGVWYVEGYCSTFKEDLGGDVILQQAGESAVEQLMGLTLLFNHDVDKPVGKVVAARVDDKGLWVKCMISKTAADIWTQVNEGVLTKFSIRLLELKTRPIVEGGRRLNAIEKMIPTEVSITPLPMNREAIAAMAYVGKSLGSGGRGMSKTEEALQVLQAAVGELLKDLQGDQESAEELTGDAAPEEETEDMKAAVPSVIKKKSPKGKPLPPAAADGQYYPEPPMKQKSDTEDTPPAPGDVTGALQGILAKLEAVLATFDTQKSQTADLKNQITEMVEEKIEELRQMMTEPEELDEEEPEESEEPTESQKSLADRLRLLEETIKPQRSALEEEEAEKQKSGAKEPAVGRENAVFGSLFPW